MFLAFHFFANFIHDRPCPFYDDNINLNSFMNRNAAVVVLNKENLHYLKAKLLQMEKKET